MGVKHNLEDAPVGYVDRFHRESCSPRDSLITQSRHGPQSKARDARLQNAPLPIYSPRPRRLERNDDDNGAPQRTTPRT
jgi:hypothetical protein